MGFAGSYVAWSVLFFLCWRDFVSPLHSFDFLSSGLIMFSKPLLSLIHGPQGGVGEIAETSGIFLSD